MSSLSGGDISQAFLIELFNSRQYFVKYNRSDIASDLFRQEKLGLETIASSHTISVPEVIGTHSTGEGAFLVLEYIKPRQASAKDLKQLGVQVAAMHDHTGHSFGFKSDNYIGSLHQCNTPSENWIQLYAENRLQKQFILAIRKNLLKPTEVPELHQIINVLDSLIPVNEVSLLHGDLWGGNYLIGIDAKPYLIDPAVYFGDRMVDIAMSKLFGGFGPEFYESYFHWAPATENPDERIDLYQLYYLLVHLNLFGASYHSSVKRVLKRYF
jgi:protein-ribulosamine 3-kinase